MIAARPWLDLLLRSASRARRALLALLVVALAALPAHRVPPHPTPAADLAHADAPLLFPGAVLCGGGVLPGGEGSDRAAPCLLCAAAAVALAPAAGAPLPAPCSVAARLRPPRRAPVRRGRRSVRPPSRGPPPRPAVAPPGT